MKDQNDDGYETCGSVDEQHKPRVTSQESQDTQQLAQLVEGISEAMSDDFDELFENRPDWIDPEKLRKGQKFAIDNYFGVAFSEMLSLYVLFAFSGGGLDTLIYTRQSDSPYRAYRRYYMTSEIVKSWLETDILTTGTKGNDNLRKVFRMHHKVQKDVSQRSDVEMREKCVISGNTWCTALSNLQKDFALVAVPPIEMDRTDDRKIAFNQCGLSVTQFGFFGLVLVYPDRFGIHNSSRQDMENFVHLWRTIGYFMGIKDEYNFCRGTLDEVLERSRWLIRAIVIPKFQNISEKWEHMSRCVAEGIRMYMKNAMTFDASFCYLCDILGLDVTNFKKSLGVRQQIKVWWMRFVMRFVMKYDYFKRRLNKIIFKNFKKAAKDFSDENVERELKKKTFKYENIQQ